MTDFFCFSWPGHRPGQEKQKKSDSAWPNLRARKPAVKARKGKEAIKNWNSTISSFPPQSVWLNALHGLVHLFISSIKFYYLDIEGFSIYLGFSIYFMYYCKYISCSTP
jgi:hypothetical protein